MPIDRKPIVDIPEENEETTHKTKSKQNISFFISEPRYSLDDVILSEEVKKEIERIVSYLKYHDRIFKEWNLQSVIKHHNLSVNLYGESGTGKTMTAHAIARMLNKQIVLVNYPEGEKTPKAQVAYAPTKDSKGDNKNGN